MIGLALNPRESVNCPTCHGSGEVAELGHPVERETGAPITRRCYDCTGIGWVSYADLIALTAG